MNKNLIRHQTVILIGKILHPLTESNLIPFPEYREIIAQLKHIAEKGDQLPVVVPKPPSAAITPATIFITSVQE